MADPSHILPRLRQFTTGLLAFGQSVGDVTESCKFVLDPGSGEPVLPVTVEALRSEELMLYLPDDGLDNPECLQVHAAATEIDPNREAAADRWLAYHQRPTHARWARLRVHSVKRLDEVIDGDLVRLANPLASEEGRLCKLANAELTAITRAVRRLLGIDVDKPMVVGVDPWGIDVRHTFGVVRLEFLPPMGPASVAEEALNAMQTVLGKTHG